MREKAIQLDGFGISENAYKELRFFCLQYNEKRQKLSRGNLEESIREKYEHDIKEIETAAFETDDILARFLVINATEKDIPPWALISRYSMPATEKEFNRKRRQFYFLLAKKKKII